jgi:carbon monoxide dehydrogenase subunit G
MRFSNSFDVSLAPDDAWKTLMDIPRIAPCMPGAELTEVVDRDTYKGKVAVRMGPVGLAFAGTAKFEERDEVAHTARVRAQGQDAKGRGGASAVVNFRLEPFPGGSKVLIDTDLNLSGSVAQYGRGAGMIQTIASQLINQFAKSLEMQIAQSTPAGVSELAPDTSVARATAANAPQPPAAKPISGFSLILRALWAGIAGLFRKKG